MRLRTIQSNIPLLTDSPYILEILETSGIKTTYDVLFTPLPELLSRLATAQAIQTIDIITLQAQVSTATVAESRTGSESLKMEHATLRSMQPKNRGLFDVRDVDDLLGSILSGPYIVELSGASGSGKSVCILERLDGWHLSEPMKTLALQLITRWLAHNDDSSVLWIDCSGDFSGEWARKMCIALGIEHDGIEAVLGRLQVVLAFEFDVLQNTLDSMEASLLETPGSSLRYVVIDPITPLLLSQITGTSSQGHATMANTMQQLARIAHCHNLTALAINRTATIQQQNSLSSFPGTAVKPALGPTFTFLAHATIWLSTAQSAFTSPQNALRNKSTRQTHIAEVMRSRVGPSRIWSTFDITDGIIVSSEISRP